MSSKSNGYIVPIRTTKEEITKIKLLITSDISLLRKFILEFVPNLSAFKAKIPNGINIDKTKINKMMSPLFGSDANECTDVIIPDLTIKVPNKENEKPKIHNNNVQDLSSFLVSKTIIECNNAVAISHGINAAFSTGSQNHHPPQPNS